MAGDEPWSHNVHYWRVILDAVPSGCQRALDVGCGLGGLTRRLCAVVPEVVGLDRDERSLELARARAPDVTYLHGDLLTADLPPASFDLVTAVASLHHLDAAAGLTRMRALLRPGGVLVVVGLARGRGLTDLLLVLPAVVGTRWRLRGARRNDQEYHAPVVWPPPVSYRQMRRLARRILPGARYRRHLYWRYSLVWHADEIVPT